LVEEISAALIGVSFLVVLSAIGRTQNLIRILPERGQWPSLRNLMAFFAVGYAVYFAFLVTGRPFNKDLVTAEVFFLSSMFMFMVVRFTYQTIHNILRLDELEELANTDELTGIYNRRAILHLLDEEFQKSKQFRFPLSVAMVDLDHFKKINDIYGHLAGDTVLKEIAKVLRDGLRRIDLLGRYGGEEFLCVLPSTADDDSLVTAERVREKVENLLFEVTGPDVLTPIFPQDIPTGETVKITVSIGVASLDESIRDAEHLVSAADTALYDAKEEGRNRTCSAFVQSI
jgi:diguanylate cyclase (GGDEF)-like protein